MGILRKINLLFEGKTLNEGTWSFPEDLEQVNQLKVLLSKPLPKEKAEDVLYDLIGDDELFDDIEEAEPGSDVRYLVKARLKELTSGRYDLQSPKAVVVQLKRLAMD